MPPTEGEPTGLPELRRGATRTQLLAAILGVLPLYSTLILYQLRRDQAITLHGFIFYLAVISPLAIVIALVLLRFLCGENPRDLNRRPGRLPADLLAALILCPVILIANIVSNYLLAGLFPGAVSATNMRGIFVEVASRPGLLVLFLVLLVPLGAASEEVVRVFLLSRLWKAWPSGAGKWIAVVISACLFGLIHVYRGPVTILWTAIFGLIAALYYLRFGRVVPLVVAHYLTNALQVVLVGFLAR